MIRGELICLRPIEHEDLAIFARWTNEEAYNSEYNTFELRRTNYRERGFAENGLLSPSSGVLAIVTHDGTVIGDISYHQQRYGPNVGSIAYNIGISIEASYRGNGYGVEAQRLLAAYLFATYPIARVEASTDSENKAEQRALEKAGFTREGVIRKAQWRNGSYHDLVIYSKLRGE